MSKPKQDFYSDCHILQGGVKLSVQGLHDYACHKCLNPDCTRSISGTSKFEQRVANWEESIFLNPSRLDPSDPRYLDISSKRFLSIVPSEPGRKSGWDDPRELASVAVSVPETLAATPTVPLIDLPPSEPPMPTPAVVVPETPPAQLVAQRGNTPNRSRQMIGGDEQKPESPVLDPWQPKQAIKPGETIVKPGAKIKLGG